MKVQQIMTASPLTCTPDSTLADVALLMWEGGCGFMPVVDGAGTVRGVITDRDICIATGTRRRAPAHMHARELMQSHVACCHPDDDVHAALRLMELRRVRRLPVTGPGGVLTGILSMDDVVLQAGGAASDISAADIVGTLRRICSQDLPVPRKTTEA